jgi:hypothetical protein
MENKKEPSLIEKFNDYIADRLSYLLSVMATFYFVSLLVFIPLFYTQPTSIVAWASYLCSVVFQGIALPVLGYTSRKASDKTDKVVGELYKITAEIERLVIMIEKQQEKIEEDIGDIEEFLDPRDRNKK